MDRGYLRHADTDPLNPTALQFFFSEKESDYVPTMRCLNRAADRRGARFFREDGASAGLLSVPGGGA